MSFFFSLKLEINKKELGLIGEVAGDMQLDIKGISKVERIRKTERERGNEMNITSGGSVMCIVIGKKIIGLEL